MLREPPLHRPHERGAILVTSLLLLLVLTIIGLTAMQMTRMQERMSGNARDMNLAFQGAESALRAGERQLQLAISRPISCKILPPPAPCIVFQKSFLPFVGDQLGTWWIANGQAFAAVAGAPMPSLPEDPHFVSEELGYVSDDLVSGQDPPSGRDFYQVSGHSTGGTGIANTVLQSSYTRRF
jgi:type IV pilus assembly protein PilX